MISHFFTEKHNGCSKDMSVQIIDHCDPNDKERRESYWIETLETSCPKGLNCKWLIIKILTSFLVKVSP